MNYQCAFVYVFKTPGKFYLYDVNTNAIIKITEGIYKFYKKLDESLTIKDENMLKRLADQGYLKPNKISAISHPVIPVLNDYLDRKVATITLQVTQQCNLRCKYCAYSGLYETRNHSAKKMSIEIAKRGVDFLISHSLDLDSINIGFYGGEPLICFQLIKDIVDYAEQQAFGKNITYNITTNGTLFNDDNLNFLQDKSFHLMISIDGPAEIHDKNRVFASSGSGTFSTIMENISYIKKHYPKLYSNITFNAVIDPTTDRACASNFFVNSYELHGATISASIISQVGIKSKIEIDEKFYINDDEEYFYGLLKAIGRLQNSTISKITEARINQMLSVMKEMRVRSMEIPCITHPSGPCIPGARKLLMDVDGYFYPCESVPESEALKIGSVFDGFSIEAIKMLLNIGKLTEEQCKKCWGIRLCTQCCLQAASRDGLSRNKRLAECKTVLKSHENCLLDLCVLRENGLIL